MMLRAFTPALRILPFFGIALCCHAQFRQVEIPAVHPPALADTDFFVFVMGKGLYAAPELPPPKKGVPFTDPTFHTTLRRLTDSSDNYIGPGIENEYATSSPENCDGSRLILRGNTAAYYLYDAASTTAERQLTVFNPCNQEPEPRWDATRGSVFYYVCNTEFKAYDVDADSSSTLHDFRSDYPQAEFVTTHSYGDASVDQRYWAFYLQDQNHSLIAVIVYDRTENRIVGSKSGGFPDLPRSVTMSPSGAYCIIGFENITYAQVYTRDFSSGKDLPDGSNGHNDVATTADGRDVLVYQNVMTDYIAMADLETGAEVPLVRIPFEVNTDIGLHFSGNCHRTPGWVLVSTYGAKNPPSDRTHSWMDCQLFMVELKSDPRIWRIAHTHSYTSFDYTGEKNFFAEAFAAINAPGTSVYFGSNWNSFVPEYTDTYQVILPDQWTQNMPGGSSARKDPANAGPLMLEQNRPNPAIASAAIRFSLAHRSHAHLQIFDILGRQAVLLLDETREPGTHDVHFDRQGLSAGVYVIRLAAGKRTAERMMVLR